MSDLGLESIAKLKQLEEGNLSSTADTDLGLAHLSGLPLNHQLTERGARLLRACQTAPCYRLYALAGFSPPRPGMVRDEQGHAIEVEVWEMPAESFGGFVDGIPAPLGIGTVELQDGEQVKGFVCEWYATRNAEDVSHLGGWRAFVAGSSEAMRST